MQNGNWDPRLDSNQRPSRRHPAARTPLGTKRHRALYPLSYEGIRYYLPSGVAVGSAAATWSLPLPGGASARRLRGFRFDLPRTPFDLLREPELSSPSPSLLVGFASGYQADKPYVPVPGSL